ncbi:hypothetical protein GCM10008098_03690 [Rhodanobacter panaciterrae]|uniref:N-acetyltransferase domain-containing protein n=1 Tax=Rhodanobacter panaciterrae TaxID=490572 RepID=A0ABQ2ZKH0_9GAMM|nr:GNAT family N-acetyltransferase [Rhodanobacter panaciterrae]GGY15848.1 hypothetical protein GCM10008098_03690 [Rhodanobacter panaciterrae]
MSETTAIECIAFRPGWECGLARFFAALDEEGDDAFFHPHRWDKSTLRSLARNAGTDLYYLFVQSRNVLAYGLLRGWDEGYVIPSLGIAVHPAARSAGLGSLMMEYLEVMSRHRGAPAVRLRVHKVNVHACRMYMRRGYRLTPDEGDERLLVGLKTFDRVAT